MKEFKFEIGQIVQPILAPDMKLMVLNRTYEDCPGGSQVFYQCGAAVQEQYGSKRWLMSDKKIRANEIELEEWKENKPEKEVI